MTRTVWKYSINLKDGPNPILEIPGGGHFLHLSFQQYTDLGLQRHPSETFVDTWWAVNTDNVPVEVQLYIRGTGDEVPPSVNYLGTVPLPGIGLVLHFWQKDRIFQDMHIVDGKFVPRSQE